ncbi:hypothetical protein DU500_16950 [Haloplanus rubicundus]|uniref:DUF4350 domain-containing protein n=1 Tax=Haloplanus rubicundus TaxID=1547898 RepID=A0A345EGS2_9EURY|nr:DUF4350 domain-containing protein [Haloplanus rubicundus]AXG07981.1 hypothetical protein DU500_16950 [Haloplanus rubicundus]AXG11394.1 hypothetical protein DU484_16895 [Haloplanus rubicundus]
MWRELGKRLVVLVLTVAVVLAVVAGGSTLLQSEDGRTSLQNPEYEPDAVVPDPIEATGTVDPDPDPDADDTGTVVIDRGHANRFSRSDIEPLVDALVREGYHVEFYTDGDLAVALEDADAFLVIDPGSEYLPGDIDDVRQFTGNGGRLVMIGEPDRTAVSASIFGTSIATQESRLTTLASRYGMSVDTQYLYNQENADGTFKHVLARPTSGELDGVEQTTMYTAAAVTARNGSVLLRSAPNTIKSGSDEVTGEYPVAVERNNVLLLGDKTFMQGDRYRVADNEQLVAYVAEFMIEGDYEAPPEEDEEDELGADDDSESGTPSGNATTTATAAPVTAES